MDKRVELKINVQEKNDEIASLNRKFFKENNLPIEGLKSFINVGRIKASSKWNIKGVISRLIK